MSINRGNFNPKAVHFPHISSSHMYINIPFIPYNNLTFARDALTTNESEIRDEERSFEPLTVNEKGQILFYFLNVKSC